MLPWAQSPSQTIFLIREGRSCFCLFLGSEFQFPASPQNYSNKPIASSGITEKDPLFDTCKPAAHSPRLFALLLAHPLCPPWAVSVSGFYTLSVSSAGVRCRVLSQPHSSRVGIPPSSTGGRGSDSTILFISFLPNPLVSALFSIPESLNWQGHQLLYDNNDAQHLF